jgi:hydroxyacylglutathione hydrolase
VKKNRVIDEVEKPEIIKTITAQQLKERMAQNPNILVLNILMPESYDNCHIRGSMNVPLNTLAKSSTPWGKAQEIIVYCASKDSPSSKYAYSILTRNGFTNVAVYEGGIQEWQEKGYPCGGECARLIIEK